MLFKIFYGNTCGWKSVLKYVKYYLKTENYCLETLTKHPLSIWQNLWKSIISIKWMVILQKKKKLNERLDILVKITVSNANDQKDHIISPNLNFLSPQNTRPNIWRPQQQMTYCLLTHSFIYFYGHVNSALRVVIIKHFKKVLTLLLWKI